jgi:hypothetical protein
MRLRLGDLASGDFTGHVDLIGGCRAATDVPIFPSSRYRRTPVVLR